MRWLSLLLLIFLVPLVAFGVLWGTLALWFKLPGPDAVRIVVAGLFALFGLGTLRALFRPRPGRWLAAFALAFVPLLLWWNTLEPPTDGNWSPEVARQVTGTVDGDILTLENVRAFEWRTAEDVTETWVTRSYDLSEIESLDLFMSYWAGPTMAHLMLSFGFADGEHLAWSVEVRRPVGVKFSPVADFFKAHSISVIASLEQDVVGLRSNIQEAEVYMFRLESDPQERRELLLGYVERANRLAEKPEFFNSLLTNCSKTVIDLARTVGENIPADWRVLVNGYFPEYLYELGAMNTALPFEEIRERGYISGRAREFGLKDGFSEVIREGVPTPN